MGNKKRNIRLKSFKIYNNNDDYEFNDWIKENSNKISIEDIKEIGTKEYLNIVVYYTEKNK